MHVGCPYQGAIWQGKGVLSSPPSPVSLKTRCLLGDRGMKLVSQEHVNKQERVQSWSPQGISKAESSASVKVAHPWVGPLVQTSSSA